MFITNVVKCRPPSNRDPLPEELSACGRFLNRQIELINPLVIVTLGRYSMARYFPLQRISASHGQGQWVNDRLIIPMFHPAAALHQPSLRAAIEHDFSLLPAYLQQAKERIEPKPVEVVKPAETEPEEPKEDAGEVSQLSLF